MKKLLATMAGILMATVVLSAQDLKIDYQFNVAAADPANYFTFQAPMRYHAADKDTFDATTGASKQNSTEMFMPYLYDVQGKQVFPTGLRGLFLFAVAPEAMRQQDNLTVTRASTGVITIQYVHRGVAYKIETDRNGKLSFPKGNFVRRQIGFIQGNNPQVLHTDFSPDGSAAKVNWAKVWDSSIAAGKEIQAGVATKTGAITDDNGVADAMFRWEGELQVSFDKNILKISGTLKPVKN
ncbi:MAG: hypothetical protein N2509_01555 [Treponemataceae bacterium]|nr:hypothetical protein [Treponemataceae bacterium]